MPEKIDMTGRVIGRLTVIEECGRDAHGQALWRCHCECGNEATVRGASLRSEHPTTSCGCYQRERAAEDHTTHGMHKTRLYSVWKVFD